MSVSAVFFDAFGTLCEIRNKRHPYKPIIKGWSAGVAAAYQAIMTRNAFPIELARECGCSPATIQSIEENIQAEIDSIQLYPETPAVLDALKNRGISWAIVSNLAKPYAQPLLNLLPYAPDASAWSFAVGLRKPEAGIYHFTCKALGVSPESVLMVGDSLENDYTTPRRLGMQAAFLQRSKKDTQHTNCVENLMGILPFFS